MLYLGKLRSMPFLPYLHRVSSRHGLEVSEARDAMSLILEGSATTAQIAGFLVALRMKGETAEELLGFAQAMRERNSAPIWTSSMITIRRRLCQLGTHWEIISFSSSPIRRMIFPDG